MAFLEPRFRGIYAVLFAVFTLFGTSMTIIGATLPRILAEFRWDYVTAGVVLASGSIAYFVSTFGAGYLIRGLGPRLTILLGLVLDIIGLALFGAWPDAWINVLLGFLIGLGQGCFEVTINWATVRLDTFRTGRPMNVMHGAFAIGAIVGPVVLGVLLGLGGSWTLVYRGIAVILVAVVLALILVPFRLGDAPDEAAGTASRGGLARHPAYWLAFGALFLYVGVELGVSNWVSEYFVRVFRFDVASASFLVSLFWSGILAGRFGVPAWSRRARPERQLLAFSVAATLSIVALPVLALGSDLAWAPAAAAVLVFLAGLGSSVVYPIVITLVGQVFPLAQSQAIGFAATGGGIGSFVFPFIMSALAQAWGIRWGFTTYAVFAVLMTVAMLFLVRASRPRPNGH